MGAFWSGSADALLTADLDDVIGAMSSQQMPAWRDSLAALRTALAEMRAAGANAHVLLKYPILRLGKRIDAVVLSDRAIFVLKFKRAQADSDAQRQTEDYGLDLYDFHEHSRRHAVVPLLVTAAETRRIEAGLALGSGVWPVQVLPPDGLGAGLLNMIDRIGPPHVALDAARWEDGAYRPVPTIIEAACMIYTRHGVAEIAQARADQRNLRQTTQTIRAAIGEARAAERKIVLFVTGIPGAGKTLCGLNAAFGDEARRGTFLTGNPSLVHVLREALARDACTQRGNIVLARRRMEGVIQQLPRFRNHYVAQQDECPAERVVVIDEAQRCWSRDYAVRKTRDKEVPLADSEPGHLLEIIGRHGGFAAIICLVGCGQEIHDGEGGLAEWGAALRARPHWQAIAAPDASQAEDARRQLGPVPGMRMDRALHLEVPVRQVRNAAAAPWVDAVLHGDAGQSARIAGEADGVPFWLVRDVAALRAALRALARGSRRTGLLASSGAARLRAEGLGAELPHMDPGAVAHWFLDRFPPDVRASDALEQVATEFSCQGLELDHVGLCWDADLVRAQDGWLARNFAGTKWQIVRSAEAIANQLNSYRVLLTRARYETVIFVPMGDGDDGTRDPVVYDGIAAFLLACGVREWMARPPVAEAPVVAEPVLL